VLGDVGDSDLVEPLLEASGVSIRHFFADGAYDGNPIFETVRRYLSESDSTIIIPPRRTATHSDNVDGPSERDQHIKMIHEHGRMAWQKATGYGRRSLVETTLGRYKSIIGDSLNVRDDDARVTEVAIGIKALSRTIRAAKPISVRAWTLAQKGNCIRFRIGAPCCAQPLTLAVGLALHWLGVALVVNWCQPNSSLQRKRQAIMQC